MGKTQRILTCIDGCLLNWLRHFLEGRIQRVVVRGTCSDWSHVTSGTPQGAILGPLLFLVYINNITDCVSSTVKLYADDTKIYREIVDPIIDPHLPQEDLTRLLMNGLVNGSFVLKQINAKLWEL